MKQQGIIMSELKKLIAEKIRDSIHNFVIPEDEKTGENELDNTIYFTRLRTFIECLEGCRHEAYYDGIIDPNNSRQFISMKKFNSLDDSKKEELEKNALRGPIITVGIGLNINSRSKDSEYERLLGEKKALWLM